MNFKLIAVTALGLALTVLAPEAARSEGGKTYKVTITNLTAGRKSARAYTALATTDAAGQLLTETPDEILARMPAL